MDRLLQSETTNTTDGCEWKLKVWLWNRWCEVLKCVCGVSLLSGPQQQHSLWIIQSVLSQQLSAHFISVWTGFSQQPRRTRRLLSVSRTLRTLKLDPLFICQQQQRRVKSWSKQKNPGPVKVPESNSCQELCGRTAAEQGPVLQNSPARRFHYEQDCISTLQRRNLTHVLH